MRQILDVKELVGKTISKTIESFGDLWIKFDDDTFAIFDNQDRTEGFGYQRSQISVSDYKVDLDCDEIQELQKQ